jgi:hexulose-6-phosphate isomerase
MKKAVCGNCFGSDTPLLEAMSMAKAAGFDGIEPSLTMDGPITTTSSEDELKRLRDHAEKTVTIHGLMGGQPIRSAPLTTNDQDQIKRGVENIASALRVVKILGGTSLLVVPGTISEDVRYDIALEGTLEGLKQVAPIAEDLQIAVAVENVWNKFLLSPVEMRNMLDEVNSPYVGCYFDVGNFLGWAIPQHWIEILAHRIKKVHVKDFKVAVGNMSGFVTLLQGDVNWKAVRKSLRDVGYDSYLSAEIPLHDVFPEKSLLDISTSLDTIIASA